MVDDDEREGIDDREAQERSLGAGQQCTNMILVNQASKGESSTRWRIFFSGAGVGIASTAENERRTVGKRPKKNVASPRYI